MFRATRTWNEKGEPVESRRDVKEILSNKGKELWVIACLVLLW